MLCCRGPDQCNNRDKDDDDDKDNDDDNVDKVTSLPARQVASGQRACRLLRCCTLTVHIAVAVVQVLLLMEPETNLAFVTSFHLARLFTQANAEGRSPSPTPEGGEGQVLRVSPSCRRRKPRPRWVFDTSLAVSKNEAAAHDVLEEVRVYCVVFCGKKRTADLARGQSEPQCTPDPLVP